VIVNIAAWYYIVNGALAVLPVMMSPFGFTGSKADQGAIVFAGLFIGIGAGLLKRHEMGRWAALGLSLLGWTLGTLLLVALLVYLAAAAPLLMYLKMLAAGGLFSALMIIAVLSLLLWVVGILISFKLFWYLCSQEGCAEFGVQYGSSQSVLASCGAWVGLAILNLTFTGAGGMMWHLATSSSADRGQAARQERDVERMNEARLRAERERAASRAEMQPSEEDDPEADGEAEADTTVSDEPEDITASAEPAEQTPKAEEYPLQETVVASDAGAGSPPEREEPPSSRKILKCRDTSGGITFTQGYCPPGSKQIDMPAGQ